MCLSWIGRITKRSLTRLSKWFLREPSFQRKREPIGQYIVQAACGFPLFRGGGTRQRTDFCSIRCNLKNSFQMKIIKRPISHALYAYIGSNIGGLAYSLASNQSFDWKFNTFYGVLFGFAILLLPIWKRSEPRQFS